MSNDKTEQPIPADFMEWIEETWKEKGNTGSAPPMYVDGAMDAYYRPHSQPLPVGEAGARWAMPNKSLPAINKWVVVKYYSGDVDEKLYRGEKEWWIKNVEKWLDESPNPSRAGEPLDCRSEIGMTVGLIDSIITIGNVLSDRDLSDPVGENEISKALDDLRASDNMKMLMDMGELASAKEYIDQQKKEMNALFVALSLANSLLKKQTERAGDISPLLPRWVKASERLPAAKSNIFFKYSYPGYPVEKLSGHLIDYGNGKQYFISGGLSFNNLDFLEWLEEAPPTPGDNGENLQPWGNLLKTPTLSPTPNPEVKQPAHVPDIAPTMDKLIDWIYDECQQDPWSAGSIRTWIEKYCKGEVSEEIATLTKAKEDFTIWLDKEIADNQYSKSIQLFGTPAYAMYTHTGLRLKEVKEKLLRNE